MAKIDLKDLLKNPEKKNMIWRDIDKSLILQFSKLSFLLR